MGILRADRVSGLGGANAINGSVHFPNDGATGTGDYLRVDRKDNSDFNLGTNDFTMEFWFNSENVGSMLFPFAFAAPTVSSSSDAGFYVRFNGGGVNFNCFEGNNTIGACTTGSVNIETWYHVAYVRSGSTFTVYLDGTSAATASSAEAVNYDAGWNFNIGSAYTNVYHYNGFLSNLRIVNGTALYTSNFTVPNRLEAVENTVLLCCQSPGNVLQEASGKSIHLVRTSTNSGSAHASRFVPDKGEDYGTTFEDNTRFDTLSYMVPPGGTTAESNRGRGLFAGGDAPNNFTITSIEIQSQGNAQDFGDLSLGRLGPGGVGSSTRGVISSGYTQPTNANSNTIDYVTIATSSNATDFGDNTQARHESGSASSETRGLFAGGSDPAFLDVIDYVTIATTGNATDFGNLTDGRRNVGGVSSPTRAVFAGGRDDTPASDTEKNILDYVTIASTGNATDFGDLTVARGRFGSVCSSTRGVFAGGDPGVNTIDYITIASTGNATDFGDTITTLKNTGGGASNKTRGAFLVAYVSPAATNAIQFVTIATTGNSVDFGDNTAGVYRSVGFSDSHGGIS